jgi:tetratricopeptide (TPR) repeat protein
MHKGSLRDKSVAELFLELYTQAATGILRLKKLNAIKNIYFQMGKPIFATSNQKEDRMGSILYKQGIINREQLEFAIEEIKGTGKKFGTVLVENEIITPEQLVQAVISQVEEIMLSVFVWEEGEFLFADEFPSEDEVITLDISAAQLIFKAVKDRYSLPMVKKILGSTRKVLAFTRNPSYKFQEIEFTPEEEKVINNVDGRKTITEIVMASGVDEEKCYRLLAALIMLKTIEVIGEKSIEEDELSIEGVSEEPVVGEESIIEEGKEEDLLSGIQDVLKEIPREKTPAPRPQPKPKVHKRDPQEARKYYEKGKELFQEGNREESLEAFKMAIALDPTIAEYYTGVGLLYAAQADETTGKESDENKNLALDSFKKAIALAPRDARNYYYLGVIYKNMNDIKKARDCFAKALTLKPDFKQAEMQLKQLGGGLGS